MRLPETTQDRSLDRMRASELPSKLFFRIGEVASLVGVEPHVLRYWEREFRSIRPTKSAKGQRVYSRKDVENLLRVRDLLYRDGFTIAGAKKRLQRGTAATAATVADADAADSTEAVLGAQASLFADVEAEADVATHDAHEADDEDELTVAEPESGPRESGVDPMREKLTALRAEVEGFLHELEGERGERGERA
jgi:DNA-binding transcriptional MerR regulator